MHFRILFRSLQLSYFMETKEIDHCILLFGWSIKHLHQPLENCIGLPIFFRILTNYALYKLFYIVIVKVLCTPLQISLFTSAQSILTLIVTLSRWKYKRDSWDFYLFLLLPKWYALSPKTSNPRPFQVLVVKFGLMDIFHPPTWRVTIDEL